MTLLVCFWEWQGKILYTKSCWGFCVLGEDNHYWVPFWLSMPLAIAACGGCSWRKTLENLTQKCETCLRALAFSLKDKGRLRRDLLRNFWIWYWKKLQHNYFILEHVVSRNAVHTRLIVNNNTNNANIYKVHNVGIKSWIFLFTYDVAWSNTGY